MMKKSAAFVSAMLLVLPPIACAGVVMDMVTRDASGQETDRTKIYAQSNKIRMEHGGENEASATMIFLGNEFLYVDHGDKSYMVMDEAMIDEVSAQMSKAMKEIEAQLASMPPEQRAMVEQMMKGQTQGMTGHQGEKSSPLRVEATGRGEWKSGKCREYAVFEGSAKIQQVARPIWTTWTDPMKSSKDFARWPSISRK